MTDIYKVHILIKKYAECFLMNNYRVIYPLAASFIEYTKTTS